MTAPEQDDGMTENVKPYNENEWTELVDAMYNYLGAVKEQASQRKEEAQAKLEENKEEFAEFEKKRKKRRNYGTRTGIYLKGDHDEADDEDDEDDS